MFYVSLSHQLEKCRLSANGPLLPSSDAPHLGRFGRIGVAQKQTF